MEQVVITGGKHPHILIPEEKYHPYVDEIITQREGDAFKRKKFWFILRKNCRKIKRVFKRSKK